MKAILRKVLMACAIAALAGAAACASIDGAAGYDDGGSPRTVNDAQLGDSQGA